MEDRIKLISLSANKELAEEIAKLLNTRVLDTQLLHFADGEVLFESHESFRGDNVYIIQSTCNPVNDRLMELLICMDACKRAGAASITCVIPYFGYSRQDRKAKARQPITCKLVADLLEIAGADRVVCVDLHATQTLGFFSCPLDNISPIPLFYNYLKKIDLKDIVCVSPDHGGVTRTTVLAEKFGAPIAIIDKRRPRPNESEVIGIVGDVKDKDCIIVDDIVDTGGTLCKAALKLKELGAKTIIAVISHGVLSEDAISKINDSVIDLMLLTNSIPLANDKCDKIKCLSLAPILSKIIVSLEEGKSLSDAIKQYQNSSDGE